MLLSRKLTSALALAIVLALPACDDKEGPAPKDPQGDAPAAATAKHTTPGIEAALAKGRAYLAKAQKENGSIGEFGDGMCAITTMAASGLIAGTPKAQVRNDEAIAKALDFILGFQSDGGSIDDKTGKRNYTTSATISALSLARIPKHRRAAAKAVDYLTSSQIHGDASSLSYGGFPYKQEQGQPADGSNANIAADALMNAKRAGHEVDPKVLSRLGDFWKRLQNHSESNTGVYKAPLHHKKDAEEVEVVSGDDGGAVYYAGNSKVNRMVKRSDGRYELKSYGSMTYAMLKCLLFAGLPAEDPRLKAAVGWIQRNWTVDRNPGFEDEPNAEVASMQGYFYYLYTAARALAEYERHTGKPLVITDEKGMRHDWRKEMGDKLLSLQREDGSWINEKAERWMEGNPVLATTYALQALAWINGRFE